jgi:translation initiation factor 2 beta subunit (eIF-2beta)/eIF-5
LLSLLSSDTNYNAVMYLYNHFLVKCEACPKASTTHIHY